MQYFEAAERHLAEIVDCAALIRYAYRKALRTHDRNWATEGHLPVAPGIPSVAKYQCPYTALGSALCRVKPGGFQATDVTTGGLAQFADAKTLQLRKAHFVTRLDHAQPGDLIFYKQDSDHAAGADCGAWTAYRYYRYIGESELNVSATAFHVPSGCLA